MKPRKPTKFRPNASLRAAIMAILFTHFAALSAFALTYYWDNNGTAAGFGTAGGTWAAPTTGSATQGWSQDATGATLPINVTVAGTNGTTDAVNFGTDTAGLGLAAGTIMVSGTVSSGNMTIGSQSGAITLSGGQINFHTQTAGAIITSNNAGINVIESTIGSSAASSALIISSGTVKLAGNNTFNRPLRIGAGGTLRFSTVGNVGAGSSNLGAPSDAARGLIQIGVASNSATLLFHDAVADASTNRQVRIGDNANGSGGSTITNNNPDAAHTLTFSNAAFNLAATGASSSFNRTLTLNGLNTGDNTISGAIIDNGASKVGFSKGGAGTWLLAGASSYSNATTISAGVLKIGADDVLPSGAGKANVAVNAGASSAGTLDLNGFNLAINGLAGSNNTVLGRIVNNATATDRTLTIGNADASATFNGVIADNTTGSGTIALTKVGAGTQTLAGASTYTGVTTIEGGTLALGISGSIDDTSSVALGGGTFDVAAKVGGYAVDKLTGSGSVVGSLTVSTELAVGNSAGTVNFESLTLGASSTYTYDLTGGGSAADLGNVSGTLIIDTTAILDLVQLGTYTQGNKFTLFAYPTGNLTGTFAGLGDGDSITDAGGEWEINYFDTTAGLNGGTGTSFVTVTAVPEPRAALLGGLGLLMLFRRRR